MSLSRNDALKREFKLGDKIRDFSWVNTQHKEGRLYLGSSLKFTDSMFSEFREIIKTVESIYPDSWDIDFDIYNASDDGKSYTVGIKGIVFHFPRVTIRNRNNNSHILKELFVMLTLSISNDRLIIGSIRGARTLLSHREYNSHYIHSHLNQNPSDCLRVDINYTAFCLGSGEINNYIRNFNSNTIPSKISEKLTPVLVQLLTLISYESIEGTPYINMSSVVRSDVYSADRIPSALAPSIYNDPVSSFISRMVTRLRDQNLFNLSIVEGRYKMSISEQVEDSIVQYILGSDSIGSSVIEQILCFKDGQGRLYKYRSDGAPIPSSSISGSRSSIPYIYQGREFFFRISDSDSEEESADSKVYLTPSFKLEIEKTLQNIIYGKEARKSTIQRYYKGGDATESVASDPVLVQADT